jgi:hypothetical protein
VEGFFFFFFEELQCHKDTPHGCSVDLKNKTKQNKQKSKKSNQNIGMLCSPGGAYSFFSYLKIMVAFQVRIHEDSLKTYS